MWEVLILAGSAAIAGVIGVVVARWQVNRWEERMRKARWAQIADSMFGEEKTVR